MAHKDEYGRFIISAGEVGSYIVCPQAWQLSKIDQLTTQQNQSVLAGNELHNEWGKEVELVAYFSRSIKTTVLLLIISAIFYFIKNLI